MKEETWMENVGNARLVALCTTTQMMASLRDGRHPRAVSGNMQFCKSNWKVHFEATFSLLKICLISTEAGDKILYDFMDPRQYI